MIDFNPHNLELPGKGKVLISEPFLLDPYFKRTIVLLCEHDDTLGSFGFILNRFLDIPLNELLKDFPPFNGAVAMGGPVDQENLYFLHRKPELIQNSISVFDDIYIGGDFDEVKSLISTGVLTEDNIRFFIGYSGWAEYQLKSEMKEKSWIVADATSDMIMISEDNQQWQKVLQSLGDKFSILSNFPEDPSLN